MCEFASTPTRVGLREMPFIVGSMMESPIGVGAAASLVAAVGSTYDLDAAWWTAGRPVMGGLLYDGSTVVLPPGPGPGVEGLA